MFVANTFRPVFALSSGGGNGASACQGDPSMRPSHSSLSVRTPVIFDAVESYLTRYGFDSLERFHSPTLTDEERLIHRIALSRMYLPEDIRESAQFKGEF